MTAKERVLMIRLMEKVERYPTYAKALVVEAPGAMKLQNINSDPKGLTAM